jgi:phytanoyl-CoA hydroxylase
VIWLSNAGTTWYQVAMPDSATTKQFYDANGYAVVERLFTRQELATVVSRLDEMLADPSRASAGVLIGRESDTCADKSKPPPPDDPIRKFTYTVRYDPVFQSSARSPKLLELVRALIGPRVKVFTDQMLLKPPGGQDKPTHQDQSYFRMQPADSLVTAWIALDDATLENGCMKYVPTSHRVGLLEMEHEAGRPVHHNPMTSHLKLPPEVSCPVPAGSVIFHHPLTLHRSDVNRTRTWRRALVMHFATVEGRSEIEELNREMSLAID